MATIALPTLPRSKLTSTYFAYTSLRLVGEFGQLLIVAQGCLSPVTKTYAPVSKNRIAITSPMACDLQRSVRAAVRIPETYLCPDLVKNDRHVGFKALKVLASCVRSSKEFGPHTVLRLFGFSIKRCPSSLVEK